jgi:hypothetical protein
MARNNEDETTFVLKATDKDFTLKNLSGENFAR